MPHSVPILKEITKLVGCREALLQEKLNHPLIREKVNNFLDGKQIKTAYKDRNGEYHEFKFGRISEKNSLEQFAYGGFLGVNLAQHFYCKFRIRLCYPRLRCAIEHTNSGHNRYYPLELLEVVHEGDPEDCIECNCDLTVPRKACQFCCTVTAEF